MSQPQQDLSSLTGQMSAEQLALLGQATKGVQVEQHSINDSDEDVLYVQDRLAVTASRVHDFVDAEGTIRRYHFKDALSWVEVPASAAMRLVTSDGFIVKDAENNILKVSERQGDAGAPVKLLTTQCVASFEELTQGALIKRCRDSGMVASNKTRKDEMIEHLIDVNRQIEGSYGVDEEGLDNLDEIEV